MSKKSTITAVVIDITCNPCRHSLHSKCKFQQRLIVNIVILTHQNILFLPLTLATPGRSVKMAVTV